MFIPQFSIENWHRFHFHRLLADPRTDVCYTDLASPEDEGDEEVDWENEDWGDDTHSEGSPRHVHQSKLSCVLYDRKGNLASTSYEPSFGWILGLY